MRRKWEYIAEGCKCLGLEAASEVAEQIDKLLYEIYGDIHTEAWKRIYPALPKCPALHVLERIAESPSYCIACKVDGHCENCRFAERMGMCPSDDSIYNKFLRCLFEDDDNE